MKFHSVIVCLLACVAATTTTSHRRPPATIGECKLCNQQAKATAALAAAEANPTEEGVINLRGVSSKKDDATEAPSDPTQTNSNSGVSEHSTGDSGGKHSSKHSSGDSDDGAGGGAGKKKNGGGGFGIFSPCKPWWGPLDPCNLAPFKLPHIALPPIVPPAALEALPGVPISSPFTSLAKPLILKSIAESIALGKLEAAAAKKNIELKKKERATINKAVENLNAEKQGRLALGLPPPGLLSDDEYPDPDDDDDDKDGGDGGGGAPKDDPCPVDASGK